MVSKLEPRLAVSIRAIRPADRTLIANAVRYTSDRTYQQHSMALGLGSVHACSRTSPRSTATTTSR